jgi:Pyruvate/2-oxoacid:ferredoxin oxidoreductase gamma subunit
MAEEITGIRLGGLGGQGVVLAGLILGHAAVHDRLYAAGSSSGRQGPVQPK